MNEDYKDNIPNFDDNFWRDAFGYPHGIKPNGPEELAKWSDQSFPYEAFTKLEEFETELSKIQEYFWDIDYKNLSNMNAQRYETLQELLDEIQKCKSATNAARSEWHGEYN